jgi:uncharacterized membrane-anchored protein
MLAAGVLGTALGDVCSHALGSGIAAVALGALLVGLLQWGRLSAGVLYWLIVAVARTAGTAIGDWLAESRWLDLGLTRSTLLTGLAFVLMLALWRGRQAMPTGAPTDPQISRGG